MHINDLITFKGTEQIDALISVSGELDDGIDPGIAKHSL